MKKKLMEAIANVGGFALSDGECVSDTIYFSDMVGLIDDLIKERKRLKKENKQEEYDLYGKYVTKFIKN